MGRILSRAMVLVRMRSYKWRSRPHTLGFMVSWYTQRIGSPYNAVSQVALSVRMNRR